MRQSGKHSRSYHYNSSTVPVFLLPTGRVRSTTGVVGVQRVANTMDDGMEYADSCNPSVKAAVRRKRPTSDPQKRVIARREQPYQG